MTKLSLYVPTEYELGYRGYLISDEATMSYNMGYGDNGGCAYYKTIEQLREWYQDWKKSGRFYAYIQRDEDGVFIGEVSLYYNNTDDWFEMGIVIEAKYRGMGYSVPTLKLLLKHAFERMQAKAVHNYFEDNREAAVYIHVKAGFRQISHENGLVHFLITKEQYYKL